MSNPIGTPAAHAQLVANAWRDPQVMSDLKSGDQSKIRSQLSSVGINPPSNVAVQVHVADNPSQLHVMIPPAPKVDISGSGAGPTGEKCYGPACLFLCGPY